MKKYKLIVDTDPGVDDTHALLYALFDPQFDIKLFTVPFGNIPLNKACRNMCHLLDILGKDIPVVKGCEKRFGDSTEDATFLHGAEGLGAYIPPKTTKLKCENVDCADAIYEVLKANPKEIIFVELGPHTNLAHLLIKHPDAVKLIKKVVMMGGSIRGTRLNPSHNSFNIRIDPIAFDHTIKSKLPVVLCPSRIGRDIGYLSEKQVEKMANTNDLGKFLRATFQTYWEPKYDPPQISTSDICAFYTISHPEMYKTKRAFISVDTQSGKTTAKFSWRGNFKVVTDLNREKFITMMFEKLEEMNNVKLPAAVLKKCTPKPANSKAKSTKNTSAKKNAKKSSTTKKKANKTSTAKKPMSNKKPKQTKTSALKSAAKSTATTTSKVRQTEAKTKQAKATSSKTFAKRVTTQNSSAKKKATPAKATSAKSSTSKKTSATNKKTKK